VLGDGGQDFAWSQHRAREAACPDTAACAGEDPNAACLVPSRRHATIATARSGPCLHPVAFAASLGLLLSSQGRFGGESKPCGVRAWEGGLDPEAEHQGLHLDPEQHQTEGSDRV